jgi:peptide chain release factor 2
MQRAQRTSGHRQAVFRAWSSAQCSRAAAFLCHDRKPVDTPAAGHGLLSSATRNPQPRKPWNSIPSASESPTSGDGWIRSGGIFDFDQKVERLEEVNRELESPDVWNDAERAQGLGRERASLEKVVLGIRSLTDGLIGAGELLDLAEMEDDQDTADAVVEDVEKAAREVEQLEFRRMFSGKMDPANAFVDIQAGAGGTEAQDWAEMLLRMYLRWCESRGWTGVHRLVRKSPFDSDNRRHTSFTSVFVSPEVDDKIDIEINPADLKTDVYRSSGAGGQHVNKTESAVRITHVPSGIVVACQTERSQHANRDRAMKMLAARLYELEMQKRNAERDAVEATKSDIGWGSQIRNYVLDQSRIKDLRTGIERSDTQKVLDGDLDEFIEASLKAGLEVGAKRADA